MKPLLIIAAALILISEFSQPQAAALKKEDQNFNVAPADENSLEPQPALAPPPTVIPIVVDDDPPCPIPTLPHDFVDPKERSIVVPPKVDLPVARPAHPLGPLKWNAKRQVWVSKDGRWQCKPGSTRWRSVPGRWERRCTPSGCTWHFYPEDTLANSPAVSPATPRTQAAQGAKSSPVRSVAPARTRAVPTPRSPGIIGRAAFRPQPLFR